VKKVGVIGGGQLARMMIPAAINLGLDVQVFAEAEDSPASLAATWVGDYRDVEQVSTFAARVEVLTFDHEHVPTEVLEQVRVSGVVIAPSPEALALTHDKIVMRKSLSALEVPQPRWGVIEPSVSSAEVVEEVGGFPCVAKKPIGGYDGKGVRVIDSLQEIEDWIAQGPVLLEEKVPFVRELALVSARRHGGEWVPWLPVETRQVDGVCSEVIAPAPGMSSAFIQQADTLSRLIADEVGIVGVLAVEVFELPDGSVVVNELAMRPHNSGHVFTELPITSQFEQHLRAVADIPLGSPSFTSPVGVMVNILGGIESAAKDAAWRVVPEAKIHDYGKTARAGRKVGHVVVTGSELEHTLARAEQARSLVNRPG